MIKEMNEVEELESELEIAKHNLWVAETTVEDRQSEVDHLIEKIRLAKEHQTTLVTEGSPK